ncbi:2139_t:CDS:2 [Acaulospora morrowiae]|uniref:2139_t:CDS:1 n=1 Tax=Acaulospora morrowiae TaxID=94023 RepID=A0A9N8YZN3_9GLOM|nr:2139_t:CDS:2 [Acaulospora morrowiae]
MKLAGERKNLPTSLMMRFGNNKKRNKWPKYNGRAHAGRAESDLRGIFDDVDDIERTRLLNYYFRFTWVRGFSSPVHDILKAGDSKVLDIGCGSKDFLLELSSEYPKSHFYSVDCASKYSLTALPHNVTLQQYDLLEGFPYDDETFDFVNIRFVKHCFSENEWKTIIIPNIMRVVKPGGWIEFMDVDENVYNTGPETRRFMQIVESPYGLASNNFSTNDFYDLKIESLQEIIQSAQPELGSLIVIDKLIPWHPTHSSVHKTDIHLANKLLNSLKFKVHLEYGMKLDQFDKMSNKIISEVEEFKTYTMTYRMFARKRQL